MWLLDKVWIKLIRSDNGAELSLGTASSGWYFIRDSFDGFSTGSTQLGYNDHSIRDGGYVISARLTKVDRVLQARYAFRDKNETERRRVLSFLSSKDTYKMYVYYGSSIVWAEGYVLKFDMPISARLDRTMTLTLAMEFPDPYWKSYDDFGKNIAAVTGMMTGPFMSALNNLWTGLDGVDRYGHVGLALGRFVFQPVVTLINDGDSATNCRVVMTASGVVVKPQLTINDKSIIFNTTLQRGDVIDINFEASPPTVRLNGDNAIGICDRTSSFTGMELKPGDNTISYEVEDGAYNLNVNVYYNERFEAI